MEELFAMTNMETQCKMDFDAKEELVEIAKEIKDLEKELEWVHSRESDEWKYIAFLKNKIDNLYKIYEEINENKR